jgi:hypothetical protein
VALQLVRVLQAEPASQEPGSVRAGLAQVGRVRARVDQVLVDRVRVDQASAGPVPVELGTWLRELARQAQVVRMVLVARPGPEVSAEVRQLPMVPASRVAQRSSKV